MTSKTSLTLFTAGVLAAAVLFAPYAPSAAQGRSATTSQFSAQQQQDKANKKKAAPAGRPAQRAAPQRAAPQRATPRVAAPHRTVTPRATRTVTPRATRTVTPRATGTVTPRAARTVAPRATRTVTPRGTRNVTAGRLRGVSRTTIKNHKYSVWRGRHRIRYDGSWRTFVALSALGAIAIGSNEYYPYAYISAPENYCEGQTYDGCQLMWQEVETIEGDVVYQCVAYCPWR